VSPEKKSVQQHEAVPFCVLFTQLRFKQKASLKQGSGLAPNAGCTESWLQMAPEWYYPYQFMEEVINKNIRMRLQ
jgi:hypothetical protein